MSEVHGLTMPKWGLSMAEGKIGRWLVEVGAEVAPGVELVEIETDKILSALEAPVPGVLRRRVAKEGDIVPVAGLLGVLTSRPVADSEIDAFIADFQAYFVTEEKELAISGAAPELAAVADFTLRYLRRGDGGEGAVLIHGFGGDLNTWLFNHNDLAATGAVYALDLPGHGGSSKHVGSGTLTEFADVLGRFMDTAGLSKAHVVGHSMGGAVALEFALANPGRARSLVLIASAGLGPEIDGDYIEGFITARRRREVQPHIEKLFANPKLITPQLIEDILKYKRLDGVELALRSIAAQFCPGGRQSVVLRDTLAQLPIPVLVIWGLEDRILPPSHAQGLPENIRAEILPGSGHMVQMESAATVNRLIGLFWDRN